MQSNPILQELKQPETEQAIFALLANLPKYQHSLETICNFIDFAQSILEDKQTINKYEELFRSYNIDIQTVEALIGLLEKLPRLVELIEQFDNLLSFIEAILNDKESTRYLEESVKSYTKPVLGKVKEILSVWNDIQAYTEHQSEAITLFTMMKWIKDPSVQQLLKYVQATLVVLKK